MIIKDLSQPFMNGMPHASTIPAPRFEQVKSIQRDGLSVTQLSVASHVGTHLDAPCHFIEGGVSIDEVAPSMLIGPAVLVSVEKDFEDQITAEELADNVKDASPGDALLIRTGWGGKFGTKDYYGHPYLTTGAARWIVEQQFRLVGTDTITPDIPSHLRSEAFDFPVHHTLLGAGVLIIEHLFLEELTEQRFDLFVGALKVVGADGAPARVLAMIQE